MFRLIEHVSTEVRSFSGAQSIKKIRYFHLIVFFFETDCEAEDDLASAETLNKT
jgi:hypothetical protein